MDYSPLDCKDTTEQLSHTYTCVCVCVCVCVYIAYVITGQYALPLETIMLPIYATDLFGEKSYGKVLGLFVSVNTAGYAVGAPIITLCKDLVGSYAPAIYAVGFVMIGVLILLQPLQYSS